MIDGHSMPDICNPQIRKRKLHPIGLFCYQGITIGDH